jgi:hypothetical protein
VDAEAAVQNRDASKVLERIMSAEASSTFYILRRVLGMNKTGALSSIMAPGDNPVILANMVDAILLLQAPVKVE